MFSAIPHELTENFYFVFYSERVDGGTMWILSSEEFLKECVTNKTEKMQVNVGYGLTEDERTKKQDKSRILQKTV